MFKLASSLQWALQNVSDIVGKFEFMGLTEAQFAAAKGYSLVDESFQPIPEHLKKWILVKGQDITGSDYAEQTGITVLTPDLVTNSGHLGQAPNESSILNYETSQNKDHSHPLIKFLGQNNGVNGQTAFNVFNNNTSTEDKGNRGFNFAEIPYGNNEYMKRDGGDQSHPNRALVNIFFKINY